MKDEHTYGEKMAGNGHTKVIYKGTFVSIQSLCMQKGYIEGEKNDKKVFLDILKHLVIRWFPLQQKRTMQDLILVQPRKLMTFYRKMKIRPLILQRN